jgi:hypothetical protein
MVQPSSVIFELSLPRTTDSTENMDDMSIELYDLNNLEVFIGIHCPKIDAQCTSDSMAAILDYHFRLLPTILIS